MAPENVLERSVKSVELLMGADKLPIELNNPTKQVVDSNKLMKGTQNGLFQQNNKYGTFDKVSNNNNNKQQDDDKQQQQKHGCECTANGCNINNDDTECRRHMSSSVQSTNKLTLLERAARVIPGLGIILALLASLFLGTAGMLVKMTTSVHGIQVAVFRAMIQLVVYATIISVRQIKWMPNKSELWPVLARAILGGSSITFSYYALKLIPLGDATTIRFSLPIWTLITSYFFLNESCSSFKIIAVAISISGVVLIAKPDECVYIVHLLLNYLSFESTSELELHEREFERARAQEISSIEEEEVAFEFEPLVTSIGNNVINISSISGVNHNETSLIESAAVAQLDTVRQFEGCMMALASSICLSLSLVAMRLCKQTPAEVTIVWLSTFSVLIGTVTLLALNEWRIPNNLHDYLYILLNGLCGSIGQWFITSALKIEQSGIVALARTFDIEIAFLYSAFLLGEQIRATSIVGSVLVSTGVLIVVIPKWLGIGADARAESRRVSSSSSINSSSESESDNQVGARRNNEANGFQAITNQMHHQQQNKC